MSRQAFLDRVRTAAAAGRAHRVRPDGEVTDRTGYVGVTGDLCQRLADEITAVGGTAHLVSDHAAAREMVGHLLQSFECRAALCWRHPVLDRMGLGQLLSSAGVGREDYETLCQLHPAEQRERMLAADIGITSVDYAIAETGTLAVLSNTGRERVASLLPPIHVAIVEAAQVIPDLFDLFAMLGATADQAAPIDGRTLPSNLTLITGPSKTGDIELELTTGVHGPGQWHVIIIGRAT